MKFKVVCALLLILAIVPAYAGTIDSPPASQTHGIYATYHNNSNYFTLAVDNGNADVTLPSGVKITAEGISDDSLKLVIFPIGPSETQARAWISGQTGISTDAMDAYLIYLIDQDGNRFTPDGVKVTFTYPSPVSHRYGCSLTLSGIIRDLDCDISGESVVSYANQSDYYILYDTPSAPQTSDGMRTFSVLSAVSLALAALTLLKKKSTE